MGTNFQKLNLLYYKHILDVSFSMFFHEYGTYFSKEGNMYVMTKTLTKNKLKIIFRKYIISEIKKYVTKFDILNPQYFIIIGSCLPKNNILWSIQRDCELSKELSDIIGSDCYDNKYLLNEKDIKVDIDTFNVVFEEIFDEMFCIGGIKKYFGKEYGNLVFIRNKVLDCYMMFKCIKSIYGDVNIVNIHKEKNLGKDRVIYSVNENIDKCITGKIELLKSNVVDIIKKEIRQYIDEFLLISNVITS